MMDLNQAVATFGALSKVPTGVMDMILKGMDPDLIQKLGKWASEYAKVVNAVHFQSPGSSDAPSFTEDFMGAMTKTMFVGTKLTFQDLQIASNDIAKAIKSENWKQAIAIGIQLAQLVAA